MATGLQTWSKTAATNASADANVNWAEGMAPSQVNDSSRAEMAAAAMWRDDNNGTLVTSGSSTAFTVVTNQVEAALTAGYTVTVNWHATADTSATLNVDSLGAKNIQIYAGQNLTGSEFVAGQVTRLVYSSTGSGQWIAHGFFEPSGLPKAYASLNSSNQVLSGGATVTPYNLGTLSTATTPTTISFGHGPLQYASNGGACTIAPPTADGSCMLQLTNATNAGTLTFSTGWTVGTNKGDSVSTSTAWIGVISMWRINSVASYLVKNITTST